MIHTYIYVYSIRIESQNIKSIRRESENIKILLHRVLVLVGKMARVRVRKMGRVCDINTCINTYIHTHIHMHIFNILHRVLVLVGKMGRVSVRKMARVKVFPRCRGSGARGVEAPKEEPAFALRICSLYQSSWGRGGARRGIRGVRGI
jgi:hypothetical protein